MEEKDFSLFEGGNTKSGEAKSADEIMAAIGRDEPPAVSPKASGSAFSSSFCRIASLIGALSFVLTAGCGTMLFYSVISILGGASSPLMLKFAAVCVLIGVIAAVTGIAMNTAVCIKNKKNGIKLNIIAVVISLVSAVSGIVTLANVLMFLKIIANFASK